MPGLTITTKPPPPSSRPGGAPPSPTRPPVSPITPTSSAPPPFSANRQTFTHPDSASQAEAIPPPPAPPDPISFDDNPDVLALKSAISILQLQRARATRDVQTLGRARDAAMKDPAAFVEDLAKGRVGSEADRLFPGFAPARPAAVEEDEDDDDDDDDSDEDEDEEIEVVKKQGQGGDDSSSSTATTTSPSEKKKDKRKEKEPPPAWRTLPKPQNVVRCPPINWAQYGVVGESLDKLHAEQQRAPAQGVPASLTPGGGGLAYEFKGESTAGEQRRLVGVAAPYAPGKDKLERKGKGKR